MRQSVPDTWAISTYYAIYYNPESHFQSTHWEDILCIVFIIKSVHNLQFQNALPVSRDKEKREKRVGRQQWRHTSRVIKPELWTFLIFWKEQTSRENAIMQISICMNVRKSCLSDLSISTYELNRALIITIDVIDIGFNWFWNQNTTLNDPFHIDFPHFHCTFTRKSCIKTVHILQYTVL